MLRPLFRPRYTPDTTPTLRLRSHRQLWHRALLAAVLPYVFLSVFADLIHLHEAARRAAPSTAHTLSIAAAGDPSDTQDAACPLCQWLRAGPQLASPVSVDATGTALQAELAPAVNDTPPSPTPLPRAFRGPPRAALL